MEVPSNHQFSLTNVGGWNEPDRMDLHRLDALMCAYLKLGRGFVVKVDRFGNAVLEPEPEVSDDRAWRSDSAQQRRNRLN